MQCARVGSSQSKTRASNWLPGASSSVSVLACQTGRIVFSKLFHQLSAVRHVRITFASG
jgi:hypothetical protein